MRTMKSEVVIAFLLGIVVALSAVLVAGSGRALTPAYAGTAAGDGGLFAVTGLAVGGNKDVLWVIDAQGQRVALYDNQGDVIQLRSVRNIRYDMKLDEFPPKRQRPSVLDIFRQTEEPEKGGGGKGGGRGTRD